MVTSILYTYGNEGLNKTMKMGGITMIGKHHRLEITLRHVLCIFHTLHQCLVTDEQLGYTPNG